MLIPRIQHGISVLLGSSLLLLMLARPGTAQYMYLDSNADGVHTAADQVNASGSTTVDIWIDTDSNRDGSPGYCATEPGALLTIGSYAFSLQAIDGTISWGAYTNQLANATVQFAHGFTSAQYWNGFGAFPPAQPPGLYRLGRLTFSVATGTPSIQIIPKAAGSFDDTAFGSGCDGTRFDSTIRLGEDWFDVDGLSFGGGASSAPVLAPVIDMNVPVGETGSEALSATDSDGQALTFTMVSGPHYAHVLTTNPGTGSATGSIHAAPFLADIGSTPIVVAVSDGASSDEESLVSTVVASPNHVPSSTVPGSIRAVAGATLRIPMRGSDADGQEIYWRLVSGPRYAAVLDRRTRPGGAAGFLELTPGVCETGSSLVTIGLRDGITETLRSVSVEVLPPPLPPANPLHKALNEYGAVSIATADFDGDGLPDMASANGAGNSVTLYRTLQSGGLQNLSEVPVGKNPTSIATGDFNEDGAVDLVVSNRPDDTITVLIGNGQAAFQPLPAQPAGGNSAIVVRCADTNRDGHLDLLLANAGDDHISSLLGRGDGTFRAAHAVPIGGTPEDLAIGDMNLDGRIDLAVPVRSAREIRILRGFGDGTFAPGGSIPVNGSPEAVVLADWNSDGLLDLAVRTAPPRTIQILLAQGDGTFLSTDSPSYPNIARGLTAGDLDLDGDPDLVLSGGTVGSELVIFQGAGNGTFPTQRVLSTPFAFAVVLDDGDRDGYPDLFLTSLELGEVALRLSPYAGFGTVHARAFSKNEKGINLKTPGGSVCIQVEPVGSSYMNSELDLTSLRLISTGTGSVTEIQALASKNAVESDSDRNGLREVSVCFARSDAIALFDHLQGRRSVIAKVEGRVADGRPFCTTVQLDIILTGGSKIAASISPNPFNPRAALRFSTAREGAVKIRIYDLHGRVVRTLLDQPSLAAGSHHVEIDGRAENGQTLASGIYFYEVQAAEGIVRGRMTILK